jgi:transposase
MYPKIGTEVEQFIAVRCKDGRQRIICDESYFGPERQRGVPGPRKRGRGTNKQPVFGIFERGGAVFAEIVPDVKAKTLRGLIRGKVSLESVVMTDGWQAYDGLVDVGYDKHFRIKKYRKEGNPFTDGQVHVNGIEMLLVLHQKASGPLQRH